MTRTSRSTARPAYTLVELLVSAALTIMIMAILAGAFSVSMETFRQLKAIGDAKEQLRAANTILRRDLSAYHFEDEAGNHPQFSAVPRTVPWDGSKKGFIHIRQGSAGIPEGVDADGIPSARATDHILGMTAKLSGKSISDVFAARTTTPIILNAGSQNLLDFAFDPLQYVSEWGEVYYFLRPTSVFTKEANGASIPLWTLYRRQRVLAPNAILLSNTPGPTLVAHDPDITSSVGLALAQQPLPPVPPQLPQFLLAGPESLTASVPPTPPTPGVFIPANRLGGWHDPHRPGYPPAPAPQIGPGPAPATFDWQPYPIPNTFATRNDYGSDVLLNNVISFRIQVMTETSNGQFIDLTPPAPGLPAILDTARPVIGSPRPQVRAMRIQIRIYDTKVGVTRQATVYQDF